MTPGQLLLKFYHRPLGIVRESLRNGGPIAQRETERQRREMESAARRLQPLPVFADAPTVTVHLMTGRRFWYQTVFCLHSLANRSRVNVSPVLYDDGTYDTSCDTVFARFSPGAVVQRIEELRAKRDRLLPVGRFPTLRERWENYPNIRKLIDVHLGSTGWKLVIDSDLLFFRRAELLINWSAQPSTALTAIDCEESYGYSRGLMTTLVGAEIPRLVNVGLCGLRSETLDWDQLEQWTAALHRAEGTNYYLEQALVAMLVARQSFVSAPAIDYVTRPLRDEVLAPRAVMHHYVANSKRWYFRYGWRHVQSV